MSTLNDLQDAASERINAAYWLGYDAAAEASYLAGYEAGNADGINQGARQALDTVQVTTTETDTETIGFGDDNCCYGDDCWCGAASYDAESEALFLGDVPDRKEYLLDEIERWAPQVDGAIEEIHGAVKDLATVAELFLELSQIQEERISKLEDMVEADAVYVDNLGDQVNDLTGRVAEIEDELIPF